MDDYDNPTPDEHDALTRRLSQLRNRPVDTRRLARRLEQQIGRPRRGALFRLAAHPLRLAAALLVTASLVAALSWGFLRPAVASAADLSRIHAETLAASARGDAMAVDSMNDAHRELASHWKHCPLLPDSLPGRARACRIGTVGHKRIACVALDLDGQLVTFAAARDDDLRPPPGNWATTDTGLRYAASHDDGQTTLVVSRPDGTWIAVIGRLPQARLLEVAESMRFDQQHPSMN